MNHHGPMPYVPCPNRDVPKPGWSGPRIPWERDPRLRYAKIDVCIYAEAKVGQMKLLKMPLGMAGISREDLWCEGVRKVPGLLDALRARFPNEQTHPLSDFKGKLHNRLLYMYQTPTKPRRRELTIEHPTRSEDLKYWLRSASNLYNRAGCPKLVEVVDLFSDPQNKDN